MVTLLIAAMAAVWSVHCEEWYMPNSNLISDQEFKGKVEEDQLSFKFIKYFTPHCPYCRYLKQVMDTLKPQKEWCFKIYDFNCQWYPNFCKDHVRGTSFPYTAIHNHKG
jgi:thiol-disulfide isomerase/thioredoxin